MPNHKLSKMPVLKRFVPMISQTDFTVIMYDVDVDDNFRSMCAVLSVAVICSS
jgi:hypothetical protein